MAGGRMLLGWEVARAQDGTATLPLAEWRALGTPAAAPEVARAWPIGRTLRGALDRGLFVGELEATFEVRGAPFAVPLLPAGTTVADATLDGRPAVLREADGAWVVDAGPGRHQARIGLLQGERSARFARTLSIALPPGGPTGFEVRVPEAPIVADLRGGVLVARTDGPGETALAGWLDAAGRLELGWVRRAAGPLPLADARVEAELGGVLALGEDVVVGVARIDAAVREGEVDHLELALPAEVEVLDVTGDQVLQWHTDASGGLVVLLRSVVDDAADATVRFQYPVAGDGPVPLRMPVPPAGVPFRGALGVEAPVGVEVTPGVAGSARLLEPRDVPRAVLALTREPLRAAFAFEAPPDASVTVARQADVAVASDRIDDLQALTVLVEDGTEVGKLLLRVRNTSRQVLEVELPPGARLTHCFRDGVPLAPAGVEGHPERVRVPLTRSGPEGGPVTHVVAPGDVLGALALRYYGDASAWPRIADANRADGPLRVGQVLLIPPLSAEAEQAFALELGWERRGAPFGAVGRRTVALPRLDLEVAAANWHLYLPEVLEPVRVSGHGPVALVDALHADPFARLWGAAFAGDGYTNALDSRRKVFDEEARKDAEGGADPFPLVGRRIRLRGVLLGTEPATATVTWVGAGGATAIRAAAALAAALAGFAAWRARTPVAWLALAAAAIPALALAHHVLGVHRALLWGADAALLLALVDALVQGRRLPLGRPTARTLAAAATLSALALCASGLLPLWVGAALVLAHRRAS